MKKWPIHELGFILYIQNGYAFKSKDYVNKGYFLIRIGNVQDGHLSLEKPKFVELTESTKRFELKEDDILISLTGNIGRVGKIEANHLPAALNQRVARLTIRDEQRVYINFIFAFLNSATFRERISEDGHGAAQQNVSTKHLAKIQIPVPPLAEQERIVAILDEAFESLATATAHTQQKLQNARELFQSTLQSTFQQKGPDWVETILGDHADFRNGMNFSKTSSGQTVKVVGVGDFQQLFWVPTTQLQTKVIDGDLDARDRLESGDFLFVRSNGNKELIGRCMLTGSISEVISHSGFTIRMRLTSDVFYPEFLCWYLKSDSARNSLIGSGSGAQISNLNQGTLSNMSAPLPPLPQQKTIVARLDALSTETRRLESLYQRQLAALAELKQSLLHQAFSGKL